MIAEENGAEFDDAALKRWIQIGEKLLQAQGFEEYVSKMDSLDINVASPEGFTLLSKQERKSGLVFCPNPEYKSEHYKGVVGASMLGPVFASESQDAWIAYPLAIDYGWTSPDEFVKAELVAANSDYELDIKPLVGLAKDTGDCNADSILIYEYDIVNFDMNGHTHCVTLNLRKKGRYAVPIRVFLNDEGLKRKDEHLAKALKSVRYED
ncbi:MAG: hypothetical protein NC102_03805 [Clostridium sp.]|nr:hypothetical protein [Clostridium sp.]